MRRLTADAPHAFPLVRSVSDSWADAWITGPSDPGRLERGGEWLGGVLTRAPDEWTARSKSHPLGGAVEEHAAAGPDGGSAIPDDEGSPRCLRSHPVLPTGVQGYLAHEKTTPLRSLP